MSTLSLILFDQFRFLPVNSAHWALFLCPDAFGTVGTLHHAIFVPFGKCIRMLTYNHSRSYRELPYFEPRRSPGLRAAVTVAAGLRLTDAGLGQVCERVDRSRQFDLMGNNCQVFCTEVLMTLVQDGVITQNDFDGLRLRGFEPLIIRRS